jgi:uncharacterized protein
MNAERQKAMAAVETWVRKHVDADGAVAHGWLHTDRVRQSIRVLAAEEGVDPWLAEIAALLHDVGRTLPGPEDEHGIRSAQMAEPLMAELPLSEEERSAVLYAVGWHNSKRDDTPLLRVLRDADMLDALGAIGIMRAFMSKGTLPAYDSEAPFDPDKVRLPPMHASDQVRLQLKFYKWLNTTTARRMAKERTEYMRGFISQVCWELSTIGGE